MSTSAKSLSVWFSELPTELSIFLLHGIGVLRQHIYGSVGNIERGITDEDDLIPRAA